MADPTDMLSGAMQEANEKIALQARLKTAEDLLRQAYSQLQTTRGENALLVAANAEFHWALTAIRSRAWLRWIVERCIGREL